MELSRRDLLKLGLFSSAALMLPAERIARTQLAVNNRIPASQLPQPFTVPFATPPVLTPAFETPEVAYYDIAQQQVKAEILPGYRTTIWGYNGITPGPTIMNKQGQRAVVRQANQLPDVHPELRYNVWTSTHLHGSCSLPQYDGYASDITPPGQYKDYQYPNIQDARTLWYHDHGVHITAENAYMGLAAQYILHDPVEMALPIPHGKYDVPLILKDAMFQQNGDLVIDDNSQSGIYGDVVLVNGRPWPLMKVEPRKYRFRVLNASVSRSYDLQLDSGEPLTVIGTDGGLMPHPQPVDHFRIGMAERYEVVIDFAKYGPGQRVVLKNLMPPNNIDYDTVGVVMAFEVEGAVTDSSNNEIPQDLNPNMKVMGLTEADAVRTRLMEFRRKNGAWTINGQTWEDVVNSDYTLTIANPGFEDVEIWELSNPHGGWFHPVHIHLVDFKVLDRNGQPPLPHERGPKDVVYVGENETVRVIMKFENQVGRYMMHCHNLVHEDHDMMQQFWVGDRTDANDPIHADPCRDKPRPLFERHDDHGGGSNGSSSGGGESSSGGGSGDSGGSGGEGPVDTSGSSAGVVQVKGIKVKSATKRKLKRVKPRRHKGATHTQGQGQGQAQAQAQAQAAPDAQAPGLLSRGDGRRPSAAPRPRTGRAALALAGRPHRRGPVDGGGVDPPGLRGVALGGLVGLRGDVPGHGRRAGPVRPGDPAQGIDLGRRRRHRRQPRDRRHVRLEPHRRHPVGSAQGRRRARGPRRPGLHGGRDRAGRGPAGHDRPRRAPLGRQPDAARGGAAVGRAAHQPAAVSSILAPVAAAPAPHAESRRGTIALALLVAAIALLAVARYVAVEPFGIPSASMAPSLRQGDSVLVDKLAFRGGRTPARGDLVVFHAPRTGELTLKRVVATAGQTVGIEDGRLVVDGRRPAEPYTDPDAIDSVYFGPVRVPAGAVFVLGDNRANSVDSRSFGAVPERDLVGRVRARIWPPGRWGTPR